jgi:hypothetical protein
MEKPRSWLLHPTRIRIYAEDPHAPARDAREKSSRPVSWLSFVLLPRLPVSKEAVAFPGFVPITVAGPLRFFTGFPNTETHLFD